MIEIDTITHYWIKEVLPVEVYELRSCVPDEEGRTLVGVIYKVWDGHGRVWEASANFPKQRVGSFASVDDAKKAILRFVGVSRERVG